MLEHLLYLTEIQGLRVYDLEKQVIGRVRDVVLVPRFHPVRVDRFLIGEGMTLFSVHYDQVESISLDGLFLRDERLVPSRDTENIWRLARDLLDKQIVDVHGRKVVRASDVTFRIHREDGYDTLQILEIDVGVRSIIRRVLQGILPPRVIRRIQSVITPKSIPWEYCNVIEPDPLRRLRLNTSYQQLEKIHPADLADIVEELGPAQREAILETIDAGVAAETLSEVKPEIAANILESLETEKAADIVEEMEPDHAADALAELEETTSEQILAEMEEAPKEEVAQLMEFAAHTAGGLMNTRFIAVNEHETVSTAIECIRNESELVTSLTSVFLTSPEQQLSGAVPLGQLLLAEPQRRLSELKGDALFKVHAEEDKQRVLELFDKYNLLTLPVVDDSEKIVGVVTADDVIGVLRQE
jgi:magnesium transporter